MRQINEVSRDFKDIKSKFLVVDTSDSVYVIACAIHNDFVKNKNRKIPCKKGMPMGGYIYDAVSDAYLVHCLNFAYIGVVSVAYKITSLECRNWSIYVPASDAVLKRYMSSEQKREFNRFKKVMGPDCRFEFIQFTSHE